MRSSSRFGLTHVRAPAVDSPKEVSDNQQTYPSSKANHSHCPLSIAVLTVLMVLTATASAH